ncbi:MAG: TetR/AcrR family transcriptional regulator [Chitinophagales bacterium]|nr:TetR/AcrR family transcriptional regulator [Chitinophagales bacterium]MDW8273617.1 TetR/AcrR family transcriptional regulator [Chitinophagales bacterium]
MLSRRELIIRSAGKLFREKGYAATSMRDLAREVGVEAPSLYNHFSSKQALLRDICFGMADEFFQAFKNAVENKTTCTDKLISAGKEHVRVIYNHLEASVVFFEEWIFLEGSELNRFKRLRKNYQQKFKALIEEGVNCNEFRKIDARVATFTYLSSLNATHELMMHSRNINPDELAEQIAEIFIKGISRRLFHH